MEKRVQELKDGLMINFNIELEGLLKYLKSKDFVIADEYLVRSGIKLLSNIDLLQPDDSWGEED